MKLALNIRTGIGLAVTLTLLGSQLTAEPATAETKASDEAVALADQSLTSTPSNKRLSTDDFLEVAEGDAGDFLTQTEDGVLSGLLPRSGRGEVISPTGVSIGLPREAGAGDGEITNSGLVSYPGGTTDSTGLSIASTAERTRIHMVIPTAAASTTYTYEITDATPLLQADGSVVLTADIESWTPNGDLTSTPAEVGLIEQPWAVDAHGQPVPTRYEVDGNAVIQYVAVSADTAFPVVADPSAWWWIKNGAGCAANIASFFVAWSKIPKVISKANKIINNSVKLRAAVKKLGGLKKSLQKLKVYVQKRSKLSRSQRQAVRAFVGFGGAMLTDLLGIGSCVTLVRGR